MKIHKEFSDMFTCIGCFKGTFSLKDKYDAKSYQVSPRCVAFVLHEPFKKRKTTRTVNTCTTMGRWNSWMVEELHCHAKTEWNLATVLRLSKAQLSTNMASTQKAYIKWYAAQTNNACYMTIIDASSGYLYLTFERKSLYSTTFACHLSRYRFIRLPFQVTPAGDMF